jgi:hypothetical protein
MTAARGRDPPVRAGRAGECDPATLPAAGSLAPVREPLSGSAGCASFAVPGEIAAGADPSLIEPREPPSPRPWDPCKLKHGR